VQRNGNYPLISSYEGELVNVFNLKKTLNHSSIPNIQTTLNSIVEDDNNYIIESDDEEQRIYETNLAHLYKVLDKVFLSFNIKRIFLFYFLLISIDF
jgi:hypothetical protein